MEHHFALMTNYIVVLQHSCTVVWSGLVSPLPLFCPSASSSAQKRRAAGAKIAKERERERIPLRVRRKNDSAGREEKRKEEGKTKRAQAGQQSNITSA